MGFAFRSRQFCTQYESSQSDACLSPNRLPLSSVTGESFPELDGLTRWLPELTKLYGKLAIAQDTYFADEAKFCEPDPVDGLHLGVENTRKLGLGIAKVLTLEGFAKFY